MHAPPRLLHRSAPLIAGLAIVLALMPPRPVVAGSPLPVPAAAITTVLGFGLAGSLVYVSSSSGLYRSASADYSRWTRQNTWPDIKLISPDPQRPDTLVFATGGDLYRSTDAGLTATKVKACGPTDIARATRSPSIIYASTAAYRCVLTSGLPSILKSPDNGLTWTTVYTQQQPEPEEAFNHIAVDSATDSHVVAAKIDYHNYGELYESWDSGTTWTSTVQSRPFDYTPINAVAINPHPPYDMWLAWSLPDRIINEVDHWQGGHRAGTAVGIPTRPTVTAVLFDPLSSRIYVDTRDKEQGRPTITAIYASEGAPTTFRRVLVHGHAVGTQMAITPNGYLLTGDATTPLTVDALIGTGMWSLAPALASYYASTGASSWLGHSLSPETRCSGHLCQYFDKGAIERLGSSTYAGVALVPPSFAAQATLPVGGTRSTVTYQTLAGLQSQRVAPPPGFRQGVLRLATGTFIPASAHLRAVPGYIVPSYFWRYMTDPRDAPDGWFRDFGLPLSKAVTATVTKGQLGPRNVVIQAFQNAIFTYDAQNPQPWQVERANVGRDYAATFPQAVR